MSRINFSSFHSHGQLESVLNEKSNVFNWKINFNSVKYDKNKTVSCVVLDSIGMAANNVINSTWSLKKLLHLNGNPINLITKLKLSSNGECQPTAEIKSGLHKFTFNAKSYNMDYIFNGNNIGFNVALKSVYDATAKCVFQNTIVDGATSVNVCSNFQVGSGFSYNFASRSFSDLKCGLILQNIDSFVGLNPKNNTKCSLIVPVDKKYILGFSQNLSDNTSIKLMYKSANKEAKYGLTSTLICGTKMSLAAISHCNSQKDSNKSCCLKACPSSLEMAFERVYMDYKIKFSTLFTPTDSSKVRYGLNISL